MNALVTGAAGFVGRHLRAKLGAAGYWVSQIDPELERTPATVERFVRTVPEAKFDVVIHLAANIVNIDARMRGGMAMFEDIELDIEICKWLEKNPPKQCAILMSSCAVDYPDDPYCIVKRNLECFAKTLHGKGVPVVVLRPFSGYGEDQSPEYPFRAILERALKQEDPLTVWGGSQVRDWIHIDDLTDAIMFAIRELPRSPLPVEVGTKVGTKFTDFARLMAAEVGYEPQIKSDETKPSSSRRRVAGENNCRTIQQFGWEPKISLQEGMRRAVVSREPVIQ